MSYCITPGGYTQLQRRMAISGGLSVKEAVRYLKDDARLRSVRETLASCSELEAADRDALKREIVSLLLQHVGGVKRDSLSKNVNNWLSDGTQAISKEYAVQLAYALRMPVENAEVWLTRLCGETFHWRDPQDIVWIYGLMNGLEYGEASALKDRMQEKGLLDVPKQESEETMTAVIRQTVEQLRTEAELEAFLVEARGQLGRIHNTAYKMFIEFLDILQNPGHYTPNTIPVSGSMSVRDVIATYMYNEYIPRALRRGHRQEEIGQAVSSAIQQSIRKNWPDETTLSRMKKRELDVTRKVLILLFLATDGGEGDYMDQEDVDADEAFESMEMRLNLMLADCGFAQLDSRTPFDWMVLYCMYADESIFLEDYMRSFLEGMFAENDPTTEPGR